MRKVLIALFLLTPSIALAEGGPCERSQQTSVKIGGVDMNELKCQLSITYDTMGSLNGQIAAYRAHVTLQEQDLKAAQDALADAQKQLKALDDESDAEQDAGDANP